MATEYIVEIVPYNPDWPGLFQEEAGRLRQALGDLVIEIYHMGSTSIPEMKAKPIIDIMVEVRDIEKIDLFNDQLAVLGYEAMGEFGVSGRRFFRRNQGSVRTHHVHIFQSGHPEIERLLNFRDYLITHPEDAAAYGTLKEELAERFRLDRASYTEAKTDFIQATDRKAREWKRGDHPV
jgi:GrpB-like predicted nucleotidyltransferase (UPF0157 family)